MWNNAPVRGTGAILAVLAAALCFATTGTARELSGVDADAVSVGAARVLIGGGLLGAIALVSVARCRGGVMSPLAGGARSDGTVAAGASARIRPRRRVPSWLVVLVGVAGVLAYQPTFFTGTRLNGVAVGTVLALGSAPIATGILNAVLRRQRPDLRWMIATAVALLGVALVSGLIGTQGAGDASNGIGGAGIGGVSASLGAGASYALYAVASKILLDRGWSAVRAMGAVFGVAAVLSVPVLLMTPTAWLWTPAGAALALWLGVITVTLAYLLFGRGLGGLRPTTVATLTLAEPLAATLLGLVVLGEQLSAVAVVGLLVLALGLAIVSTPGGPRGRGRASVA